MNIGYDGEALGQVPGCDEVYRKSMTMIPVVKWFHPDKKEETPTSRSHTERQPHC
jgi:hypothetical protein